MHDLERDIEISKRIWNSTSGVFEEETLKMFTNYLAENPDWLVIDFGSHIGLYIIFERFNFLSSNIKHLKI